MVGWRQRVDGGGQRHLGPAEVKWAVARGLGVASGGRGAIRAQADVEGVQACGVRREGEAGAAGAGGIAREGQRQGSGDREDDRRPRPEGGGGEGERRAYGGEGQRRAVRVRVELRSAWEADREVPE